MRDGVRAQAAARLRQTQGGASGDGRRRPPLNDRHGDGEQLRCANTGGVINQSRSGLLWRIQPLVRCRVGSWSRFYESAQAMLTYRSNPITLTLLGASQVTVGKLAYRRLRRFIKPAPGHNQSTTG